MLAIRRLAFNHYMNEFLQEALQRMLTVYRILKWNMINVLIGLLNYLTSRELDPLKLEITSHPKFLCHEHCKNITQMPKYSCAGKHMARSLCLFSRVH